MATLIRWLGKAAYWLLREWWEFAMSVALAGIATDLEFDLILDWQEITSGAGSQWLPLMLYLTAALLLWRWVKHRFFTYAALRADFEHQLKHLNSDNLHLRVHAIEELLQISRKSRRLHSRAIDALTTYLRAQHPAEAEEGREVTLKKKRFGPPGCRSKQKLTSGFERLFRDHYDRPRHTPPADTAAAIDALTRRRKWFDDPRKWIDLSFTNLASANFEDAFLGQFSFVGANLRYANFQNAKLRRASFCGAVIVDANLGKADLRDSSFLGVLGSEPDQGIDLTRQIRFRGSGGSGGGSDGTSFLAERRCVGGDRAASAEEPARRAAGR